MTSSYRMRSLLAVLAIILFFVLYFALVAGLLYLVYLAIMYPMMRINRLTILGKPGAIAGSVMLFVFTLKFIFKLRNHRPEDRIKLSREDFPDLWDFVYRICDETGAPKPKAIFADPNVNAYVWYTNLWLSLIFPVRKELIFNNYSSRWKLPKRRSIDLAPWSRTAWQSSTNRCSSLEPRISFPSEIFLPHLS